MKYIYPYSIVDGHIIVSDGDSRLLIDTGAPSSVGDVPRLSFAGKVHEVAQDYMGVTPDSLSASVGTPVNALIGADVLNQYDLTVNPSDCTVTLNDDEESLRGESIPLAEFMGIPIVQASVRGQNVRMFFDTGAKLSYLDPRITRSFPSSGSEEDFYPGAGSFRSDTYEVPIVLGQQELVLRVGNLPPMLQMTLMVAGTSGILGTAILSYNTVCLSMRRKVLTLDRIKT